MSTVIALESLTQFIDGTLAEWNNQTVPVPKGLVVIASDTGDVRLGDGTALFQDLPTLFKIQELLTIGSDLNTVKSQIALKLNITDVYIAIANPPVGTYPDVINGIFTPDSRNGLNQSVTFVSRAVEFRTPTNTGASARFYVIVTTQQVDVEVRLGANVKYLQGDGLLLLKDQVYQYLVEYINGVTYLTTKLMNP